MNLAAAFMNKSGWHELFTGWGYGSDEEAACEGVVIYVDQAAMKSMPWDRLARRVKNVDYELKLFSEGNYLRISCKTSKSLIL